MWKEEDYQFMSRAIHLAKNGKFTCRPNPLVGCVITKDGKLVAEGWHAATGKPHAEINALNVCDNSTNSSMYITLEPCSYHGRTPPCTQTLINAKVKQVIVSMCDPNPKVSGLGIKELEKSGIKVKKGLLEQESARLNIGFIKRMTKELPYVRCKMAQSLDGATALANGTSRWISSPEARYDAHYFRAGSCAILTSADTVARDNSMLNPRDLEIDYKDPIRVIVDRNLKTSEQSKIFEHEGKIIIYTQMENRNYKKFRNHDVDIVYVPKSNTWLSDICKNMAKKYEINEVLIESGATFSGAMIDAGLVDELVIYIAPKLFGNESLSLFKIKKINKINDAIEYEYTDIRKIGKDLRLIMKPKK